MSRFLVFGTLAWDRYIFLDRDFLSGARIHGHAEGELLQGNIAGTLGGGGANAGLALINAGHTASVYAPVSADPLGDQLIKAADRHGLDLQFVRRVDCPKNLSLILVEPNGERTIIGVSSSPKDVPSAASIPTSIRSWRQVISNMPPLCLETIEAYAPHGILLRAPFSGFEHLSSLSQIPIVAHWPLKPQIQPDICDVLICSMDDIKHFDPKQTFKELQNLLGQRMQCLIVTNGQHPGWVCNASSAFRFEVEVQA